MDTNARTALPLAAKNGHDTIVAQLLARKPTSIDSTDSYGWTVLHCAAFFGAEDVMTQLLAHCSPTLIDAKNGNSNTALHVAAREQHEATR